MFVYFPVKYLSKKSCTLLFSCQVGTTTAQKMADYFFRERSYGHLPDGVKYRSKLKKGNQT